MFAARAEHKLLFKVSAAARRLGASLHMTCFPHLTCNPQAHANFKSQGTNSRRDADPEPNRTRRRLICIRLRRLEDARSKARSNVHAVKPVMAEETSGIRTMATWRLTLNSERRARRRMSLALYFSRALDPMRVFPRITHATIATTMTETLNIPHVLKRPNGSRTFINGSGM